MKLSTRDVVAQLSEDNSPLASKIQNFQKTVKANRTFDDGTKRDADSKRKFKKQ